MTEMALFLHHYKKLLKQIVPSRWISRQALTIVAMTTEPDFYFRGPLPLLTAPNAGLIRVFVRIGHGRVKKCVSERGHGLPGLFPSGKVFGVVETIHSTLSG
jgi:hypothetical protein